MGIALCWHLQLILNKLREINKMKITKGLARGQVLQRNAKNVASAMIEGSCSFNTGIIELRVLKNNKVLPKHSRKVVAKIIQKKFTVKLSDLKIGGPYTVELRVKNKIKVMDHLNIPDIYVGDVWICAGQSNMEGIANLKHAPKPNSRVRAFYMNDEWKVSEGKIHFMQESIDVVHSGYGNGPKRPSNKKLEAARDFLIKGLSPANNFGLEMLKRTKVPQGLIPCAHGGTSMNQWSPDLKDKGGESLYGAMLRRYKECDQPIAGIIWYQGESDANQNDAAVYTKKMIELVNSTREDMNYKNLPWIIVQLGCHIENDKGEWNDIQEQQRLLPQKIKHLDVAPAIDLELDDGIHIGGEAQNKLGKRLARLAEKFVKKSPAKSSLLFDKVELIKCPDNYPNAPLKAIKITYRNVVGKLTSQGLPSGFVLLDIKGHVVPGIFKTTLEKNAVILHTNFDETTLDTLSVSYGDGRYSYCNICDSDDMSIPVIKAFPINKFSGPYLTNWKSAYMKDVKSISKFSLASLSKIKNWKPAPLRNCKPLYKLGVLPKQPTDKKVGIYAMETYIESSEPTKTLFNFGSNIPFKLWLNNKLVVSDLQCTAPVSLGNYLLSLNLKKGINKIQVVLQLDNPAENFGIGAKFKGTKELEAIKLKI